MSKSPSLVSWTLGMPPKVFRQFIEFSEAVAILKSGILAPGQVLVCAGRCAMRLSTKELGKAVQDKRALSGSPDVSVTAMVPNVFSDLMGETGEALFEICALKVPRNELVVSAIPAAKQQSSDTLLADLEWLDGVLGKA
ncbi:MAG: hypothetical protein AAF862_16230 [Pseudomonadota bacterium]